MFRNIWARPSVESIRAAKGRQSLHAGKILRRKLVCFAAAEGSTENGDRPYEKATLACFVSYFTRTVCRCRSSERVGTCSARRWWLLIQNARQPERRIENRCGLQFTQLFPGHGPRDLYRRVRGLLAHYSPRCAR